MDHTSKLVDNIVIENFKSIEKLELSLGRLNVFIGENGAGKSNVIEAIAFAAAAAAAKTDNEFLTARGIRVSRPSLMRSAFDVEGRPKDIKFKINYGSTEANRPEVKYQLSNDDGPYSDWRVTEESELKMTFETLKDIIEPFLEQVRRKESNGENFTDKESSDLEFLTKFVVSLQDQLSSFQRPEDSTKTIKFQLEHQMPTSFFKEADSWKHSLGRFVIYSPENSALRSLQPEGQIVPLGINGEGLLSFLGILAKAKDQSAFKVIKSALSLFRWFSDLSIDPKNSKQPLKLRDRFMNSEEVWLDQRSANEGFLFAAFYFSLFASDLTPKFFAIDNIDASLNPRLCQELTKRIAHLAKQNGKQAILTTHNPAILDGLDLKDPEQRLFIVSRDRKGRTRVRRYSKTDVNERTRLSELFIGGLLGGIPKGF